MVVKSGRGKTFQFNFHSYSYEIFEFLADYEIASWPFAKSINIEQFCLLDLCNNIKVVLFLDRARADFENLAMARAFNLYVKVACGITR